MTVATDSFWAYKVTEKRKRDEKPMYLSIFIKTNPKATKKKTKADSL